MKITPIPAKTCPFCGHLGDPNSPTCYDAHEGTKWGSFVCSSCGAIGPDVRTEYAAWDAPRKNLDGGFETWGNRAISEWNTRADIPQ